MGVATGFAPIIDTTEIEDTDALFDALLAIIPDPDTRESPSPREPGSMLDEMSHGAAAQLRAEITALKTFANGAAVPGA